jgi:NAD(P)-dependent dehydrogenase (short-subunit alcohol dehydrogenase family)
MTGVPPAPGYAASKHALFGFFDLAAHRARAGWATLIAPDSWSRDPRQAGRRRPPPGKSPMQESKIMTTERCAEMIVTAMEKRKAW